MAARAKSNVGLFHSSSSMPMCVSMALRAFSSASRWVSTAAIFSACVAYTPCSDGVGGEAGALANARLIAAAPDLLEALRAAVADWDEEVSRGRWLDAARAAIKKAEEA